MKILVLFILLVAALVLVQVERNDCYWHGVDHAARLGVVRHGGLALATKPMRFAKRVTIRRAQFAAELCTTMHVV